MRKFLIILSSLAITQWSLAQGKYVMRIDVTIGSSNHVDNNCDQNFQLRLSYTDESQEWIRVRFTPRTPPLPSPFDYDKPRYWDNYTQIVYQGLNPIEKNQTKYYTDSFILPNNRIPKTIFTYGKRQYKTWPFGCGVPSFDQYSSIDIGSNNYKNCYDTTVPDNGRIKQWWSTIRIQIYPETFTIEEPVPITKRGMLPIDDTITIAATAGYDNNLYQWEWGVTRYNKPTGRTDTVWTVVPSYLKDRNFLNVSATDLLGSNAESYANAKQNIFFRSRIGCNYYSNIIPLSVQYSAPHIADIITTTNPKCFGGTGSIKIKFDRALKPNETLNVFIDSMGGSTTSDIHLDTNNCYNLPKELAAGQYKISLNGSYPDTSKRTYTEGSKHKATFQVKSPAQIIFTATKQNDVRCFGGNDGAVRINISGGTKNYRIVYRKNAADTFPTKTFLFASPGVITGLSAGTYTFSILDANGCFPKNGSGVELKQTVQINQPTSLLDIDYFKSKNTTGAGLANGSIEIILKGGTPLSGGGYNVTWKKLDGTILSSVTNTTVATGYQTILKNIVAGDYILNATDSNFTVAASGATQGCMLIDTLTVTEPPPIAININEQKYISCKNDADGQLVAHATGGVPFTDGNPYKYQWFKKISIFSTVDLRKTDSIVTNLSPGRYYVVVKDSNGITQTSPIFVLSEPDILSLQFSTQANTCQGDGSVTAIVTGGTTPYHVEWTTNDTTATINNQKEGDYYAKITDAHGCVIGSSVHLAIPQGIKIDSAITQTPSYYNSQDGAIQLTISGGNPPYTYRWGNGATTKDLQNITAGIHAITITDASGCTQTQTYTLQNPIRIIQTDGAPLANGVTTKTLCNGQHIDIDATIPDNAAVYNWRSNNSFIANTAKVTLTNAGKYWVTIIDSKGITASDTLIIKQNNTDIDASFVVSTQAFKGEKVTFVNISYPAPERISWLIPNNPKIETIQNNQNLAELVFKDTGTYTISMKAFMGGCEKMITKKVIVIEGQQFDDIGAVQNPYIKEFTLAPNPNTGQFNVKIVLQEQGKIRLRMMNISNSAVVNNKELSGSSQYTIPYNITLAPGVYILLLETAKGNQMLKMIVN